MRMWAFFCLLSAFVTLLIPAQMGKAASSLCGAWSTVSSPNIGSLDNQLVGVAAISTSNAWAVGDYVNSHFDQTLIEHWNGTGWSVVRSPNISHADTQLYGIAALSAKDIWAVGVYHIGTGFYQTMTEHWNGRSWKIVPSLNPGSGSNYLSGVTVISANDVWAVGTYYDANVTSGTVLIEHWNGTSWNLVAGSNPKTFNSLNAVTALSAQDIWAVGATSSTLSAQALIEHWNGTSWSVVKSPTPLSTAVFFGVAGASANDVWAVGYTPINKTRTLQTLIEHWNGTAWSTVSSPNPGSGNDLLDGVAAISANDAWAVGYDNFNETTLIEHWDGTSWSVVSSPNPSSISNLFAVASVKGTSSLWTVGYFFNSQEATQTLTEFYC